MKAILAALSLTIQELKTKANAALQGMLPIDQYEGAKEVGYALNTLNWVKTEVETMLQNVAAVEAKFAPEVAAAAELLVTEKIAAQVAAGELIKKADAETAIAAAKLEGEQTATAAFQLRETEIAALADRRKQIETAHGAEVAACVLEESLKGETFESVKTELARRVTVLAEMGVTAATKKTTFAEIACSIPFDEDGVKAFDQRIVVVKELVGPKGAAGSVAATLKTPGSGQPTAPNSAPETSSAPAAFAF